MADSDDEIAEKAKKYGWSPSEVDYYKSLRGDIPQAIPNQASTTPQTQSGQLNPQNIDPDAAAGVAKGMANTMWAGGTAGGPASMNQGGAIKGVTGGGSVMFGDTVIADHQRPALGYKNAPKYAEGGEIEKPHDQKNLEELKTAFSKFLNEEAAQKLADGGEVKKRYPKHPPADRPPQVPGLEEQQQMDMKKKALSKMRGS